LVYTTPLFAFPNTLLTVSFGLNEHQEFVIQQQRLAIFIFDQQKSICSLYPEMLCDYYFVVSFHYCMFKFRWTVPVLELACSVKWRKKP